MNKKVINLGIIKDLRQKNKATFKDIGRLLDIGTTGYYKKEHGDRRFTIEEAKILAEYYNTTIEELFFE